MMLQPAQSIPVVLQHKASQLKHLNMFRPSLMAATVVSSPYLWHNSPSEMPSHQSVLADTAALKLQQG